MKTINLSQEQPSLKLVLPDNQGDIILTLKRVPNRDAVEFDRETQEIIAIFEKAQNNTKACMLELEKARQLKTDLVDFEKKLSEAKSMEASESIRYFYSLVDHICTGFDKEKFDEIDINKMGEIAEAVIELRRPDTATEKKSE